MKGCGDSRCLGSDGSGTLDVDCAPNDAFRVVQLTPPGSGCSIQIGRGLTDAPVGSLRNVYLVVTDLEAARIRLREHAADVDEILHKVPIDAWDGSSAPGLDPGLETMPAHAELLGPGWQPLGVAGTRLPQSLML